MPNYTYTQVGENEFFVVVDGQPGVLFVTKNGVEDIPELVDFFLNGEPPQ